MNCRCTEGYPVARSYDQDQTLVVHTHFCILPSGFVDRSLPEAEYAQQVRARMTGQLREPTDRRTLFPISEDETTRRTPQPCAISVCSILFGSEFVSEELPIWVCSHDAKRLRERSYNRLLAEVKSIFQDIYRDQADFPDGTTYADTMHARKMGLHLPSYWAGIVDSHGIDAGKLANGLVHFPDWNHGDEEEE